MKMFLSLLILGAAQITFGQTNFEAKEGKHQIIITHIGENKDLIAFDPVRNREYKAYFDCAGPILTLYPVKGKETPEIKLVIYRATEDLGGCETVHQAMRLNVDLDNFTIWYNKINNVVVEITSTAKTQKKLTE